MKRFLTLASLTLVLAACGGPAEPPAPPPLDPTGTFDISVDGQDMAVTGTVTIRQAEAGYSGYIDTDIGGASMANIVVSGNVMTFTVPDAGVTFTITFEGDGFTGTFDGAMGSGNVKGVKRAGA